MDFYPLYMAEYYLQVESDDDVLIRSFKKKTFDDLDKARRYALQHIPLGSDDVMVHVFEIVDDGSMNHIGDVWATSTYTYNGPCDYLWCPHGSEESDRVYGISQSGKLNKTLYKLTRGDRMRSSITFPAKLKTYGNSYCIPVPKAYAERLDLLPGDDVDVTIDAVKQDDREDRAGQCTGTRPGKSFEVWKQNAGGATDDPALVRSEVIGSTT